MIGALTTQFIRTTGSDPLRLHDTLRITFAAPKLWYATESDESELLRIGLEGIYDDRLSVLVPTSQNPYVPGALVATIDFLYPKSSPATVADAINDLLAASSFLGEESLAPIEIRTVEKLVGKGAAAAGTKAAGTVFHDEASGDRAASDATALEQREKEQDALDKIGAVLLTSAKVVAGVAIAGGILYGIAQVAALKKTASAVL